MRCAVALFVIAATSCATSDLTTEPATFGALDLSIPAGWHSRDLSRAGTAIAIWTPADNANRESVTLLRTLPLPAITDAGAETMRRLVEEAQRGLPGAAFGRPSVFRSQSGMRGVSTEGTFIPPGETHAYRRIHAVLVDGTSLVHVMFTAGGADASREAFDVVLLSLRRKEG